MVDSNPGRGWKQPGTWLESTNVPSIETLETKDREKQEEPPARQHKKPGAELVPDQLNDRPPQTDPRGVRLPNGWKPDQPVIDAMRAQYPHIDLRAEHDKFTDYWIAKAGKDARKVNWNATWRSWIRRTAEDSSRRSGPTRNGRSTADLRVEQTQALKDHPSRLESLDENHVGRNGLLRASPGGTIGTSDVSESSPICVPARSAPQRMQSRTS